VTSSWSFLRQLSEIKFESGQADITCNAAIKERRASGKLTTLFECYLLSKVTNLPEFWVFYLNRG